MILIHCNADVLYIFATKCSCKLCKYSNIFATEFSKLVFRTNPSTVALTRLTIESSRDANALLLHFVRLHKPVVGLYTAAMIVKDLWAPRYAIFFHAAVCLFAVQACAVHSKFIEPERDHRTELVEVFRKKTGHVCWKLPQWRHFGWWLTCRPKFLYNNIYVCYL